MNNNKMEKNNKRQNKSLMNNTLEKIFLLSHCLEEPKDKKDWFIGKFEDYMMTINRDVDNINNITREGKYNRKIQLKSYSQNRKYLLPDINKYNHMLHLGKGNKYFLKKKYNSKKRANNLINSSSDISKNNSSIINLENNNDNKNNNINTNYSEGNTDENNIKDITKKSGYSRNETLNLNTLPSISTIENKNKYITKNINNISEKTDLLEKQLIKQEKMKYIGFKSKYNRLYNNYKKLQVDADQYIDPKKYKQYKFNLIEEKDKINAEKMGNLKRLMKQISNKIKNKHQNKPDISDIIKEVKNFKNREIILRERIKKSHDRFDYLINDSNIIQKRINIKCKKSDEI